MSRRGVGTLGGLVVLVLAAGAYMAPSELDEILPDIAPSSGSSPASAAQDEDVDADALAGASSRLDALTIAELGHGDDYDRDLFGQRWADIDRNGCDQRIISVLHRFVGHDHGRDLQIREARAL